ncbi:MAG: hypothetical protein LC798_13245 [Chloroflexi bacterium]|nr:hypothetical protein [Chloroflexota bacterium]
MRRFKVTIVNPLTVREVGGDLVLEVGDEDVEVARELVATPPAIGDTVRVHEDEHGDYVVSGVIE